MIRAILAPNDLLTPIDLRVKTCRVNVELFTYYHEPKVSSRKVFFGNFYKILSSVAKMDIKRLHFQSFSIQKVTFEFFSKLYFRRKSAGLDLTPIYL